MYIRTLILLTCMVLLQGCATVALTAGGLAASLGLEHTLNGIVYKTIVSPPPKVRLAALNTLNRMSIIVNNDTETKEGWVITADATDRDIEVQIERLTPSTTRMRVIAQRDNGFLQDRATASEIIAQTVLQLEQNEHTRNAQLGVAYQPDTQPTRE